MIVDQPVIWERSFKCDHCKKRHMVEGSRPTLDRLQTERIEKCRNGKDVKT